MHQIELVGDLDRPITAASLRLIRLDAFTQFATDQAATMTVVGVERMG